MIKNIFRVILTTLIPEEAGYEAGLYVYEEDETFKHVELNRLTGMFKPDDGSEPLILGFDAWLDMRVPQRNKAGGVNVMQAKRLTVLVDDKVLYLDGAPLEVFLERGLGDGTYARKVYVQKKAPAASSPLDLAKKASANAANKGVETRVDAIARQAMGLDSSINPDQL